MIILMLAIFCCCIPMAMPSQHIVAFCGDLGFASQNGAAMLSVLLGVAFLARQLWGWFADRIGGLQTLLVGSLAQATALSGFMLTRDEPPCSRSPRLLAWAFSDCCRPMSSRFANPIR